MLTIVQSTPEIVGPCACCVSIHYLYIARGRSSWPIRILDTKFIKHDKSDVREVVQWHLSHCAARRAAPR
jgi:hypothetical protein